MASPSPPKPYEKSDMSPFYYGLAVIGSAALVLAVYHLIIVRCCSRYRLRRAPQRSNQSLGDTSRSFENSHSSLTSTFKYQRREIGFDNECAVCLSVFEDGEALRQLPQCKHSFHANCIDMWLYSHSNCPLCRATVPLPAPHHQVVRQVEDSQQGLQSSQSAV